MSFSITVLPVLAVEDAVATGRHDAVLVVMPEHECKPPYCFWPDVGETPRMVVAVSDYGGAGPLSEEEAAAIMTCSRSIIVPGREHAQAILDFSRTAVAAGWRSVIVHCRAAVSRSPAAAVILAALQDGPGQERGSAERIAVLSPFGDFAPNLSLIHHADDLLAREGALLAACRAVFPALDMVEDDRNLFEVDFRCPRH